MILFNFMMFRMLLYSAILSVSSAWKTSEGLIVIHFNECGAYEYQAQAVIKQFEWLSRTFGCLKSVKEV